MSEYALSRKAVQDIDGIAQSTIESWGLEQADTYVRGLHAAFQRLVDFPELGRDASHFRPGYRRMETARHVVFYRITESGVLIARVLHARMDFRRHL